MNFQSIVKTNETYCETKVDIIEKRISNESALTIEVKRKNDKSRKRKPVNNNLDNTPSRKLNCTINQARYGTVPLKYFLSRICKNKNKKCNSTDCKTDETRIN